MKVASCSTEGRSVGWPMVIRSGSSLLFVSREDRSKIVQLAHERVKVLTETLRATEQSYTIARS